MQIWLPLPDLPGVWGLSWPRSLETGLIKWLQKNFCNLSNTETDAETETEYQRFWSQQGSGYNASILVTGQPFYQSTLLLILKITKSLLFEITNTS